MYCGRSFLCILLALSLSRFWGFAPSSSFAHKFVKKCALINNANCFRALFFQLHPTVRVLSRNFFSTAFLPPSCCCCCCQLALRLKVSSHFFFSLACCLSTFLSLCMCVWVAACAYVLFFFSPSFYFFYFYVQRASLLSRSAGCLCSAFFSDGDRFFRHRCTLRCWLVCVGECVWVLLLLAFANRWRCRLLASFFLFVIRFIIIVHRSVACM